MRQLPVSDAHDYWLAITQIEAQDILIKLRISDWPNMKSSERRKWHRELYKMAYPATMNEKAELKTADLAAIIFAKG